MRSVFQWLLSQFLTPTGLVVMGALDSMLVFFLPFGIDFAVIVVTAQNTDLFWLYALLATAGSVGGAAVTFWVGRQGGEHGLTRLIPESRLERVKERVSGRAAVGVAALGIIPPPFPFKLFILAAGAFGANPWSFFATLAGVRLGRFLAEAALAAAYGTRILEWMDSTVFEVIIGLLIVVAVGGTIVSGILLYRKTRS
jgi:membrane protein YqaA with SNARE-associated domain